MGLFSVFMDSISKGRVSDWIDDFEFIQEPSERAYLKRMAMDTVLNYIARTMSPVQFRFKNDKQKINSPWDYVLNVRPNKNMSSADFWQKFFYKLLCDNEVLVIQTDDNQLLIADDFERKESAVYEDTFSQVMVKGYEFKRSFPMSKVIYLEYNNDKLDKFANGLFKDYGELFGRVLEVSMRNNQIRGSVSVDTTGTTNNEKDKNGLTLSDRLQKFIDKIYVSFKTSSVAIIPKMKGFDYEEYTNKMGVNNQKLDELEDMKKSLINDLAKALGVPPALIHGEMADLDGNLEIYRLLTSQLVNMLQSELNSKLLFKYQYQEGTRIRAVNVLPRDPLKLATQVDKLVASGTFLVDEVRYEFEHDPLPNGEGKKLIRTKNYEEVKGGENNNAGSKQDTI